MIYVFFMRKHKKDYIQADRQKEWLVLSMLKNPQTQNLIA